MILDSNTKLNASPEAIWHSRLRSATKSEKRRRHNDLEIINPIVKSPLFTPVKGYMDRYYEMYKTPSPNEKICKERRFAPFETPSPFDESKFPQFRDVNRKALTNEMQNYFKLGAENSDQYNI